MNNNKLLYIIVFAFSIVWGTMNVNAERNVETYDSDYGYIHLENSVQKVLYQNIDDVLKKFYNAESDAMIADCRGEQYYTLPAVSVRDLSVTQRDLMVTINSVMYDHPQYYFLDKIGWITSSINGKYESIRFICNEDFATKESRIDMNSKIEASVNQYMSLISNNMSDYQKEYIIHNAIIDRNNYAITSNSTMSAITPVSENWAHTIEGILGGTHKGAVCEGYAKAFQLLLNAAGIPCNYVVGIGISNGRSECHAWNQVKLGGKWYNVDTTWDDPIYYLNGVRINKKSFEHFNIATSKFINTHRAFSRNDLNYWCYDIQQCDATTYSYSNIMKILYPSKASVSASVVKTKSISLVMKSVLLGKGEKCTNKATAILTNSQKGNVKYISSNSKIATVNNSGLITAKKAGSVTITAQSLVDGKKVSYKVTVKNAPKSVKLNKSKLTLKKNKSFNIKYTLSAKSASKGIKYTSSKSKIATVSSNGKIVAKKKGKTTITVTTFNGKKAKMIVTVK